MQFLIIIPARYKSSRFPGKPLADILGKTMIRRVYEQAVQVLPEVVVATDDARIEGEVRHFGGLVVMTADTHRSGTDRCAEALDIYRQQTGQPVEVVINIQGDEPLIRPEQIREIMTCFKDPETRLATLIYPIHAVNEIDNPNIPKVVMDKKGRVLYFSRSPIPYLRDVPKEKWPEHHVFYRHIGMYGYRADTLAEITRLAPSLLEQAESLEQNRWLENGYTIKAAVSAYDNYPVDIPEDIENIIHLLNA